MEVCYYHREQTDREDFEWRMGIEKVPQIHLTHNHFKLPNEDYTVVRRRRRTEILCDGYTSLILSILFFLCDCKSVNWSSHRTKNVPEQLEQLLEAGRNLKQKLYNLRDSLPDSTQAAKARRFEFEKNGFHEAETLLKSCKQFIKLNLNVYVTTSF